MSVTPETLVRPFQTNQPAVSRVYPPVPQPKVVKLQIGRHGATLKTMGGNYSLSMTFYVAAQINEQTQSS